MAEWEKKRALSDGLFADDGNVRLSKMRHFKSKPAPPPPTGFSALPKIGNYQPKSLLSRDQSSPGSPTSREPQQPEVTRSQDFPVSDVGRLTARPLIMGDKDTPLQIDSHDEHREPVVEDPTPAPRKKRAPAPPGRQDSRTESVSESLQDQATKTNPLFERVGETNDRDDFVESQEGVIDFGLGSDNLPTTSQEGHFSSESPQRNSDMPYIPPPDYDDVEMTLNFEEEVEDMNKRNNRLSLYTQYEGDDFGKYLKDDDYEFDLHGGAWRPPKNMPPPRSHRKHDQRFSKPKKQKKSDQNRNTIRNFAYTDSKIGHGDRTVKSTSAKGRYIKREKDRRRLDMDPKGSLKSGPNYEEFLQNRNGLLPDSPQSSDSGLGEVEDMRHHSTYYHSQPKQMKHEGTLSSMWKRLTWRFKKNVSVSRYDDHR